MTHLRHQQPLCLSHLEPDQVAQPCARPPGTCSVETASQSAGAPPAAPSRLQQANQSSSHKNRGCICLFCTSVLSTSAFCRCPRQRFSPPLRSWLRHHRLGLPLLPLPCLCPCSSGLYWVNKLTQCPTLLMRTRSHDRPLPTLKLSSLRDGCHFLLCTGRWKASCSLQGR